MRMPLFRFFAVSATCAIALSTFLPADAHRDNRDAEDAAPPNTVLSIPQPDSTTPPKLALKEMGDTLKHMQRALSGMMVECNRHQTDEYTVPMFDEPGWYDPYYSFAQNYPVPDFSQFTFQQDGDLLPPRKKWLDFYMGQVDQLTGMLQNDLSNTKIPQNSSAKADWEVANDSFKAVSQQCIKLRSLVAAAQPSNDSVFQQAHLTLENVQGIDNLRKRVLTMVDDADKKAALNN